MKLILILWAALSFQLQATPLIWQKKADLLQAVQEIYPTVFQGEIYVAGGLSSELPQQQGHMTAAVQIYNPSKDQWRYGPSLPEGRHHAQLVAVADELFLLGGFVQSESGWWSASADVLQLDQKAGRWAKVAELPAPISETVTWVLDGKIHLISGRSPSSSANGQWADQRDVNSHWVFDPQSLSTSQAAALPVAKNSAAGVSTKAGGYLLGGRQVKGGNQAQLHYFDARTAQWRTLAAMPKAQAGLAAAWLGPQLLAFGGEFFERGGGVFSQVWSYEADSDLWQQRGQMPLPRHGLGAVTLDNAIYLIGGATAAGLKQTSATVDRVSGR
ncbi:kelch-like protein [Rheinheimera mesophila]|uniref:Kelch-like protein n=1 Tax=Rheinheimera mesophila TaxID=1547515 RepID=A0A3P3QQQ1_9GAMM|nr:kelch repeat-containing protein [Rheinheimera mesophila]KKL02231.1 galactose oxidase [Rheinheimera mesophila]RRJ23068.1 kelch-like protein [Rheinheimera mesophila]